MDKENKKATEHPLSILANEAYQAFSEMGFEIALGPELESEWYNFDVLNVPGDHPARDMQDTFWIKDKQGYVLRTHCTSVSARQIEKAGKEGRLPCAFISIGKVFRNEATDATHEMQFYQIDGVMIGSIEDGISLANLKGVLARFYKKMLGEDSEVEFRPSFFPFTEPSIEIHAKFKGKWLEMMGSGQLHPNVLKNCGLDPTKVQGFAFGGGLDRIAMIKWGIPDVRLFYQGDLRLNQF
ncbi:phenylalanine--tRNA ligase subunit alpha [Candidatus Nomurabacteria bacterium RIFCSPHIGHO2_01_FULL_37_25]|uniref:phenylalanine--tRNA ligase n=1 Tax=Candidatus Nomurabacteria bacterium RIFCSPLOWO2_01_FULL_36_16 TaxID=1801767 RepID=A0A1F6WXW0_9BACT|nr:MAG: phenylalanine--tRNA ligase subunit alpha [Candidatus Nomurabacteria bacterium RIFCSPHIGHO2_01_FULL_37_25]OGI74997.1 MAG: phenylalanine--tRNA ligase subunit alpha [Candidatus Nomurabacteria bacterium RIFCSPHIGHO2_02_FULL_36_29]OGI86703.1 MAG: phenylalanine--tRNA ligase subunit alpha [Candidatus Nomurabacteria bacterium RIFCSPLOWO2_01_FULL_36_16]